MPSKPSTSKKKVVAEKAETKEVKEVRSHGLAITSLAVGVFAFLFGWAPLLGLMLGAIALIFGIVALVNQQNKGMAIAGLVLGSLAILASVFFTALGFVLLSNPDYLDSIDRNNHFHFDTRHY